MHDYHFVTAQPPPAKHMLRSSPTAFDSRTVTGHDWNKCQDRSPSKGPREGTSLVVEGRRTTVYKEIVCECTTKGSKERSHNRNPKVPVLASEGLHAPSSDGGEDARAQVTGWVQSASS